MLLSQHLLCQRWCVCQTLQHRIQETRILAVDITRANSAVDFPGRKQLGLVKQGCFDAGVDLFDLFAWLLLTLCGLLVVVSTLMLAIVLYIVSVLVLEIAAVAVAVLVVSLTHLCGKMCCWFGIKKAIFFFLLLSVLI